MNTKIGDIQLGADSNGEQVESGKSPSVSYGDICPAYPLIHSGVAQNQLAYEGPG